MKKLMITVFCLLLTLLWACAAPAAPAATPEPGAVPAPSYTPGFATEAPAATAQPTAAPTEAPEPEATDAPVPTAAPTLPPPEETEGGEDLKAIAEEYIDCPVEELYAAIGYPLSSDYAPSCLGDGEDGNLYYQGFTVYTYRENGEETVSYVE